MRKFETGATRNDESAKFDYEGFLSPSVIRRFGQYMHEHRKQKDGTTRDSDNWQKGIPRQAYVKSMLRHAIDVWTLYRGGKATNPDTSEPVELDEALAALLFNVQGLLHEVLLGRDAGTQAPPVLFVDSEHLDPKEFDVFYRSSPGLIFPIASSPVPMQLKEVCGWPGCMSMVHQLDEPEARKFHDNNEYRSELIHPYDPTLVPV